MTWERRWRGPATRKVEMRRGMEHENLTAQALNQLMETGRIATFWPGNRREDTKEGTDFVIQDNQGNELPFQVKSSKARMEAFKKRFPYIPVVVVENGDSVERLANKIVSSVLPRTNKH